MLVVSVKEGRGLTLKMSDGRIVRIERGHGQQVKIDAPRDVEIVRDGAVKKIKDASGDR